MDAIQGAIRGDREAIIAVVAEHFVLNDEHLRQATVKPMTDPGRDPNLAPIEHGAWLFVYDSRKNVIYLRV